MAKKIPSSLNILPQAIYVFAITVLLLVSGYFLFWLGKNASTIEGDIEHGMETVSSTIYGVGGDIVDYVEEGGHYVEEGGEYIVEEGGQYVDDVEQDIGIETTMPPTTMPPTTMPPTTMPPTTMPPTTAPPISDDCPNLLIKRGNQLVLYNKNKPEKMGENPIYFKNLDEYIYYSKVQRVQNGKNCPVLYLQEETTAQGEDVYRIRPGPFHTQGGVYPEQQSQPSMMRHVSQYFQQKPMQTPVLGKQLQQKAPSPFNRSYSNHPPMVPYLDANHQMNPKGFYGIDPTNQYIGKYTILDQIHDSTKTQNPDGLSDNPMDPNWGGAVFTNKQIVSGKYSGDVVNPNALPTSTAAPMTTSSAPMTTSAAPMTTSSAPMTTSAAPMTTSSAPMTTSAAPMTNGGKTTDDPMNTNWGGAEQTRQHVNDGNYAENNVKVAVNTD